MSDSKWVYRSWVAFGALTQVLFGFTVLRLFPYLRGEWYFSGAFSPAPGASSTWWLVDGLLALQFAVSHSLLLLPPTRKWLSKHTPSALYGCIFCFVTCLSLLSAMEAWQPATLAVWRLDGLPARVVDACFLASWGALFYSLYLTGLGYQTGLTPWWHYTRGQQPPRRGFEPKGAYRLVRHPVYLSFLGLIWFNPAMTIDRMVLALIWTSHIFIGSYLKDRRLVHYIGETYRDYQRKVPGYPFLTRGPLGKLRTSR